MDVVLTIICATIVIGLLVFIHEGGHFLAARAFGVRVTEFMLGMPGPSVGFTRGETRFGVTCVPLGGYARVCGMEPGEMSPHLEGVLASLYRRGTATMEDVAADCGITPDEAYDALEELVEWGSATGPTKQDKYNTYRTPAFAPTKRQMKRAAARGETLRVWKLGEPRLGAASAVSPDCVSPAVGSVAEAAGSHAPAIGATSAARTSSAVASADADVAAAPAVVNDSASEHALFESEYRQQYRALPFWKRAVILVAGPGTNLLFTILAFVVLYSIIGIDYRFADTGEVVHVTLTPLQAIQGGFLYIGMVVQAIAGLFNPATAAETVSQSTSIVGIAIMSKDALSAGIESAISFTAMISVSLGLMNLLPIPPLDGGKLVIEIVQKISRRIASPRVVGYVSMAGMVLFIGFFAIMLNQDIQRFVFGNW